MKSTTFSFIIAAWLAKLSVEGVALYATYQQFGAGVAMGVVIGVYALGRITMFCVKKNSQEQALQAMNGLFDGIKAKQAARDFNPSVH